MSQTLKEQQRAFQGSVPDLPSRLSKPLSPPQGKWEPITNSWSFRQDSAARQKALGQSGTYGSRQCCASPAGHRIPPVPEHLEGSARRDAAPPELSRAPVLNRFSPRTDPPGALVSPLLGCHRVAMNPKQSYPWLPVFCSSCCSVQLAKYHKNDTNILICLWGLSPAGSSLLGFYSQP